MKSMMALYYLALVSTACLVGCAANQYLVPRSKCVDGGPDNLLCKEVHVVK